MRDYVIWGVTGFICIYDSVLLILWIIVGVKTDFNNRTMLNFTISLAAGNSAIGLICGTLLYLSLYKINTLIK
jgi:hypothetical protein